MLLFFVYLLFLLYIIFCCCKNLFLYLEVILFLFGLFLDFFGCIGVLDFLNVLFIFVCCDGVVFVGNVFVMMFVVFFGWVNFLVMLFLGVDLLWVLIGVMDVCDVVVVIGWVFLCFWIVIFGIEVEDDDEEVVVEIEVDEFIFIVLLVMILFIDWLFFELLFIFG